MYMLFCTFKFIMPLCILTNTGTFVHEHDHVHWIIAKGQKANNL